MKRWSRRDFLRASAHSAAALSAGSLLGCARSQSPALPLQKALDGYRALVCVFLHGGNDGYNMLVPTTPEKYRLYEAARLELAVPRAELLALDGTAADGCSYGVHARCAGLAQLYGRGHAALLANVGSLSFPTSKSDVVAGRVPPGLFSHLDQQEQWQTAHADASSVSGWAGRIGDVLDGVNGNPELPLNLSVAGSNLLQRGERSNAFQFSAAGAQELAGLDGEDGNTRLRAAFDRLQQPQQEDLLELTYAATLDRGIRLNHLLAQELAATPPLTTVFPAGNVLADQLRMVAHLIGLRERLSMRRQIFYVSLGGFDTHGDQASGHPRQLQRLSEALTAFYSATEELGIADSVTAFTASDFGRSLTVNGKGTDHGWGNHQWIVGGAVRGGGIYGMPPSLVVGGEDDTRGGRFIPQTAVDEFAATLTRWFGVGDGDLNYVLPNLGRFASRNLGFLG
jgi:uncharacterized protein (DUF1501 family)